ncbi:YcjF family protein [Oceanisphaera pacifica]|uniref:50S ribosome-binding GTPase n=1 Tax=Oceanisphaera pacifica TaxID=2818389 RepID=A0ABS3NIB3_9GAMM|nr:GTPase [Oceanisphaera pacifica]MBO1520318.1 50S ribosome-binding GTPase [Oceanisphaera pacifica]
MAKPSDSSQTPEQPLPTLWLLGKTGAGKSSIIQALTGSSDAEVGNGFSPCTNTSFAYHFPQDKPLLRFLDTRGLGEAHYDPSEDIRLCQRQSHVLLVVAKIEEQEQSAVLEVLRHIRKQKQIKQVLLVCTAVNTMPDADKSRLLAYHQEAFEKAWGSALTSIEVDFDCDSQTYYQREQLVAAITKMMPLVGLMLNKKEHASQEEQAFLQVKNEVLWYATGASFTDLFPLVGLVSVPAMQAKMLHSLAKHYEVPWNTRGFAELIGVLGTSFSTQYGVKLGARQLVKLIPVYGQTLGAATAAAVSFGTTYGLGRAACYYFYRKSRGETVNTQDIQQLYKDAFELGKKVAPHE